MGAQHSGIEAQWVLSSVGSKLNEGAAQWEFRSVVAQLGGRSAQWELSPFPHMQRKRAKPSETGSLLRLTGRSKYALSR